MNKKIIFLLALLLLLSILLIDYSYLQGEEKEQVACYIKGNKYLSLSEENKLFYVMGLIDMLFKLTRDYNLTLYSDLAEKTNDMTAGQIKAIFDKYLEEHPEKWHCIAAGIFTEAFLNIVIDN